MTKRKDDKEILESDKFWDEFLDSIRKEVFYSKRRPGTLPIQYYDKKRFRRDDEE